MASSYPPICSPLSPNPAATVLHSPALPPSFHRSSSTPSSSYASSLYSTGYDSTLESASSLVQKYLSSSVSPQPPALYQVPAFGRSASPVNGAFNSAMAKFTSPTSGHSPTPVLLSPSFSSNTSSRSYHRPGFHNHQHHSGDQLNSHRLAFGSVGQHRKSPSAAAYGYATGRSLNKADILLDRKAFISLEKSINWQSLLNENSNGGTSGHVTSCSPTPSSGLHIGSEVESFRSAPCHHHQHHNSSRLSPVTGSPDSGQGSSSPASKTADNSPDWNSSSEQQQRDFSQPGMKDVPAWLKLLRLHKYAPFFARMSYEEMLELTEDILEHRHITKGARQKLILSIQKLKARSAVLLASEHELLLEGGRNRVGQYRVQVPYSALSKVLFQIRAFLSTPIRPLSGHCSLVGPCGILGSSNASSSSSFLVDFNNNSSSNGLVNCQSTALSAGHKELLRCWSALNSTDDLPDIMTRLIGHVHHILVEKCKKRLKKLKLWQEHFKDIHDKLAQVNTDVHLDHHLFERYPHPRDSSEGLSIPGATTATAISHANDSENDDDEDSGLLDLLEASSVNMTGERSSPASSSANGTDKDSGVDGDSDTGSLDDGEGAGGGGLSAEEEEELYLVLRTVLDKCLTHEAFTPHQALYRHWRQQLQCMISSLRHMVTADALRTGSPFGSGIKSHLDSYWSSSSRHLPAGHCKSPIPPSPGIPLQCHSPNSLNKHNNNNKVSMTTFQSCTKKSPSITSSYPKTTNSSPSSSVTPTTATASLSAGRRLLHNRLRSSITLGGNGGNNNSSTVSSALHRNGQLICSSPEEVSRSFDRRSCFKSTTSKTSETSSHHISASTLYSNLSVIPRLSATLFPSAGAPAVGHGHSNTAFTGNSPEANLRNLLLQQLLTTQQQCSLSTSSSSSFMTTGHNRQTMPLPPTALDAVSSVTDSPCALSPDQLLLHDSSLINNSTPPGEVTTTTSIDSYSANCGQLPATTLTVAATGDNEQHVCRSTAPAAQSTAALDNGCSDSRWSLHGGGHLDDDETKKHLDWNASAGLLSSLQYTANTTTANVSSKETNGGKQLEEMLCFNLFDNNMEMSNCWPGVNSSYPTTATVSSDNGITGFDDIEQLCIRMAEHALDINDDSIYS